MSRAPVIPRVVHQSYKSRASMTPSMVQAAYHTRKVAEASGWTYKFYSDIDCREYIRRHVPFMLSSYDTLIPGAYKADLFRYCLIYSEGGLWIDITDQPAPGIRRISEIVPSGAYFVASLERIGICACHAYPFRCWPLPAAPGCYPAIFQAILAARAGCPTLRRAMGMISANCASAHIPNDGCFDSLAVTGPVLLGRALRGSPSRAPHLYKMRVEGDYIVDQRTGRKIVTLGESASGEVYRRQFSEGSIYREPVRGKPTRLVLGPTALAH